jgi:peptide/nickel transport system ATP-binding protein
MSILLEVEDLHVSFGPPARRTEVVRGLSLRVDRGECLALVGESGSGKSVTARSLVGLAGDGSRVEAARLRLLGDDLSDLTEASWRQTRGRRVGFVLQDALSSLDALRTVGREVAEPLRLHGRPGGLTKAQRDERVRELLVSVGIPEPELRAAQYPHQLSGGLRQRALIASAIACEPELLIADEPTTALDATVQRQILDLLAGLKSTDMGLLLITHDLSVVADIADRVAVMRDGVIVESGRTEDVLQHPQHAYTKALLAAVPSALPPRAPFGGPADGASDAVPADAVPADAVLTVTDVTKRFVSPDRATRTAVDGVSFTLQRGRTLGIVGESGSGKSTTARIVMGLESADSGLVLRHGQDWGRLSGRRLAVQRRRIQMIYQDPLGSFDPRYTVERIVGEALPRERRGGRARRARPGVGRLAELLDQVGLPVSVAARRPLELSGGQRQRVAIARAIAAEPHVIVCDEPVSALDVSIQAQILDLLVDVQDSLGVSYLFISHDLGVIRHISHDVLVMKDARVVESGPVEAVFEHPAEDYTRELLAAIPGRTGARV